MQHHWTKTQEQTSGESKGEVCVSHNMKQPQMFEACISWYHKTSSYILDCTISFVLNKEQNSDIEWTLRIDKNLGFRLESHAETQSAIARSTYSLQEYEAEVKRCKQGKSWEAPLQDNKIDLRTAQGKLKVKRQSKSPRYTAWDLAIVEPVNDRLPNKLTKTIWWTQQSGSAGSSPSSGHFLPRIVQVQYLENPTGKNLCLCVELPEVWLHRNNPPTKT